jgi:hypothetical protein
MTSNQLKDEFPYPFKENVYRYSNNSVLLDPPISIEITGDYLKEMKLKRELLEHHPERCYQSLPETLAAQWEIVDLIIHDLVHYYPNYFRLDQDGDRWTFHNLLLREQHQFRFGDPTTLPIEPLDFIGRHVQEDLILMMQKDGDLFLDAGQLCFPANWSLAFKLGMNFKEIHSPIPGFQDQSLDDKILRFLLQLEAGKPWWRKNWSLMAGNRLDTSLETFDQWGKERRKVTRENVGDLVHLRVEVQKLFRLPRSHGILFSIHTHLMPLSKFVTVPEWLEQFYAILSEMPSFISDYKGISTYKETVLQYLKEKIEESR